MNPLTLEDRPSRPSPVNYLFGTHGFFFRSQEVTFWLFSTLSFLRFTTYHLLSLNTRVKHTNNLLLTDKPAEKLLLNDSVNIPLFLL